jgi:hypothetical protein
MFDTLMFTDQTLLKCAINKSLISTTLTSPERCENSVHDLTKSEPNSLVVSVVVLQCRAEQFHCKGASLRHLSVSESFPVQVGPDRKLAAELNDSFSWGFPGRYKAGVLQEVPEIVEKLVIPFFVCLLQFPELL